MCGHALREPKFTAVRAANNVLFWMLLFLGFSGLRRAVSGGGVRAVLHQPVGAQSDLNLTYELKSEFQSECEFEFKSESGFRSESEFE